MVIKMKMTAFREKLDRWHYGILILIALLALTLRLIGIDWGMPYSNLHPDEGLIFGEAYGCTLNHSFEVRQYYRPNHVTIKLNTLLYSGIQELYFAPQGLDDFATNYSEHFALFTTASRVLMALFGEGVVILAYLIARFWGKNQALFAGLLFAVFPAFIEHSHYITPDIPLLFFLMGVLWAALCFLKKQSVAWLFWMSFFTAVAFCEKYPGIYGCAIIAVAVCLAYYKKPLKIIGNGLLAILFLVLGIMAVSPVLIVDYKTVLETMAGQNSQYHLGGDGLNFGQTLWFYTKTAVVHLGLVLTVSCIYGIVRACMKNTKQTILLLAFLIYIIPISTLKIHWERYTLPIYAVGLLFAAFGIFYMLTDMQGLLNKGVIPVLIAGFLLFLLPIGNQMSTALAVLGRFLAPDTRIYLQSVFEDMGVTKDNTVYDCNTPLDPGGYYGAFCNFDAGDPSKFKYGSGPKYVMTSSAQRDIYLESDQEVYGWIANFYRALDENYDLVCVFPVEEPSYHFVELQNMWYAARSVYRYIRGAAAGYEIRLYQLRP